MVEVHLTRELLGSVATGERGFRELVPDLIGHLVELCPHCRSELEAFQAELEAGRKETQPASRETYDRAVANTRTFAANLSRERWQANTLLAEILDRPATERLAMVEGRPRRFHGPALAELLLEASLEQMPGQPQEALDLARLARTVLRQSSPSSVTALLYARATAHVGNALRVLRRLAEAAEAFADARFLLRQEGSADRLLEAEIESFSGSLYRDQRRFAEATRALERALETYTEEGRYRDAILTLLKLATVHREQGDVDAAIVVTKEALGLLDPGAEPRLCAIARHNLAEFLIERGRPLEARELLAANLEGHQTWPDPLTPLRHLWLEARIARSLGDNEAAELSLRAVRDGFLRQKLGYDAAVVALDLAMLYLDQGRNADVQQIAEEIASVFTAHDIHREALAAFLLFQEAARREQLTAGFLRELSSYLEAARRDPSLPFRRTS